MSRTPALLAAAAVAVLTLTSCSGGGLGVFGGGDESGSGAPAATLTPRPGVFLGANSTAKLGTVVVDKLGFTLYRYDKDSATPPTSTCVDACAEKWTPMEYSEPVELEGVQQGDVGKVTRADGVEQVTIGGWPIYLHPSDSQPGATDGHGADGAWFAVKPDGEKAAARG